MLKTASTDPTISKREGITDYDGPSRPKQIYEDNGSKTELVESTPVGKMMYWWNPSDDDNTEKLYPSNAPNDLLSPTLTGLRVTLSSKPYEQVVVSTHERATYEEIQA